MSEAIIVVGSDRRPVEHAASRWTLETAVGGDGFATVEILGQSVLQRTVAELKEAKFDDVSICVDGPSSSQVDETNADATDPLMSAWESVAERLRKIANNGAAPVLISELSAYAELDFTDLRSDRRYDALVPKLHLK